jgi:capsular exopolysaccharide synthesis family protein
MRDQPNGSVSQEGRAFNDAANDAATNGAAPRALPNGNGSHRDSAWTTLAQHRAGEEAPGYMSRYVPPIRRDEDDEDGFDLQGIVAMLLRRRKLVVGTFLGIVLLVVIYTWTTRPIYSAMTTVLIADTRGGGRSPEMNAIAQVMGSKTGQSQETQIEILKSKPIQQAALKSLPADVQKKVEEYILVSIADVQDTQMVAITTRSYYPEVAAALSNKIAATYINISREQNKEETREKTNYVARQLKTVKNLLDDARVQLRDYKEQHGLVDLSTQATGQVSDLAQVQAELRQARAEQEANKALALKSRELAASLPQTLENPSEIVRPVEESAIRSEITKLQSELAEARQEYTDDSEPVRTLQNRLSEARLRLKQASGREIRGWTQTPNQARLTAIQKANDAEAQVRALAARITTLEKAASVRLKELERLPEQEYKLGQLSTVVAAYQQNYQTLSDQYTTLSINQEGQAANASIWERAEPPTIPISPRKGRNLIVAVIMGLLCAVGLAALVDRLDDRVHTDEDAQSASGLPILTHVPFIKEESKQCLIGNLDTPSALLESYRLLRTNIAFSAIHGPIRSVVLTSSLQGEGKSICSMNLATSMALSGKKVIVVDCDLRRPKVHRLVGLHNNIGFTSVVSGQVGLGEALRDTSVPGLRVLTSGPLPPNPPEFLDSPPGREVLEQVTKHADFVIYDCPPSLAMTDAQIVAISADAILLVISCKEAGKREVARTTEILSQSGTRLLGAILNKMPMGVGSSLSGYYGGARYGGEYSKGSLEDNSQRSDTTELAERPK